MNKNLKKNSNFICFCIPFFIIGLFFINLSDISKNKKYAIKYSIVLEEN